VPESQPQWITTDLIAELRASAASLPRLRTNHNFHTGPDDNPHRFLNAMLRGTYCQPHRHVTPPKAESWIILEGAVRFFTFDDSGAILTARDLAANTATLGVDLPAGVWHTLAVTSDCAVIFEVKPGPWDPATDKGFAPWAPAEGAPEAARYLQSLLDHRP
jgi:cupin fold WbuC family metalloprotein